MITGPLQRVNASRALGPGSCRALRRNGGLLAATLSVGLLAGCGSSASAPHAAHSQAMPRPKVSSRLRAQEEAIHKQVLASLHHDSDAHVRYGSVPAALRNKQAPPADQTLTATTSRPATAIQGNGVVLRLPHGTALATAVGPDIPQRIQGSAALHTPATWDLTFTDVHGTIPISPKLFTVTDEQGLILAPRVTVVGGGPLPRTAPTGRSLTLVLKTTVSIGDGKLRYAPTGGAWLAQWDFDVETD